jgi:hypothetical protein
VESLARLLTALRTARDSGSRRRNHGATAPRTARPTMCRHWSAGRPRPHRYAGRSTRRSAVRRPGLRATRVATHRRSGPHPRASAHDRTRRATNTDGRQRTPADVDPMADTNELMGSEVATGQHAPRQRVSTRHPSALAGVRASPPTAPAYILRTSTPEALSPRREKGPLTCCPTSSGGIIQLCDCDLRRRASPQVSGPCMGRCTPLAFVT